MILSNNSNLEINPGSVSKIITNNKVRVTFNNVDAIELDSLEAEIVEVVEEVNIYFFFANVVNINFLI